LEFDELFCRSLMKLKLVDLLELYEVELPSFKIHLATISDDGVNPLQVFLAGRFRDDFQAWQRAKNFRCKRILSLIDLNQGDGSWLFAGVYDVTGAPTRPQGASGRYYYSTLEVAGIEDLAGRVIVRFPWKYRQRYLHGAPNRDSLFVDHILAAPYTVPPFPGYENVRIAHQDLRLIVREVEPTWKTALSNVAGVYLILDGATGKHYVGSASGVGGIWHRWSNYASDGHGGNRELRKLTGETGPVRAEQFQYSVLEVLSRNEAETSVLLRENHWKLVLGARNFGLNAN
jgi:hypothetical protein